MNFPKHQQAIRNSMYFLSGILGLNGVIESVNNSVGMPSTIALALAIALIGMLAATELALRKGARRWVLKSGKSVAVTKLGVWPRLACAGALSLLLVPKFIVYVSHRAGGEQLNNDSAQASSNQQPQSSPTVPISDDNNIQFLGAYIEPEQMFFNERPEARGFYEVVNVYFNFKNYSDKPLMLTSMDVTLVGGRDARLDDAGRSRGVDILGQDPDRGKPTIIEPGEAKSVSYEYGLHLPGISEFFLQGSEKLNPIVLVPYAQHTMTSTYPTEWASGLRDEFIRRYGEDLTLRVNLFSNFRKPVKTFEVKLAQAEIGPEEKGGINYDFFVGGTLLQLAQAQEIKATVLPPVDWDSLERRRRRLEAKSRKPSGTTILYSVETLGNRRG